MKSSSSSTLKKIKRMLAEDPVLRELLDNPLGSFAPDREFLPAADSSRSDTALLVRLDVPGVQREHLRVRLNGDRLVIEGRRAAPEAPGHAMTQERNFGVFTRSFRLPPNVKGGEVSASLVDGVLTVTVPLESAETSTQDVPIG